MREIEKYFVLLTKKENTSFDKTKHIILLTFDDNYINQSINLILSLSKYHKKEISYICICPELKKEHVETLLQLDEGIQVRCYNYLNTIDTGKWPACTLFRLFAPWLLEETIHKVIYLDSDFICKGSIEKILDMEPRYIAMCPEIAGNGIPSRQNTIQKYLPTQVYCNAGICVMNLRELRACFSFEELLNTYFEMQQDLAYNDQDFLNFYFKGKIELLNSALYNHQPYELKHSTYYKMIQDNCRLIHFSGDKPWNYKCELYLIRMYLKYTEYPPMRDICKRALRKSYFHAVIRLNRPVQR